MKKHFDRNDGDLIEVAIERCDKGDQPNPCGEVSVEVCSNATIRRIGTRCSSKTEERVRALGLLVHEIEPAELLGHQLGRNPEDGAIRAAALLSEVTLDQLARATPAELLKRFGLTVRDSIRVAAAFELGRRALASGREPTGPCSSAAEVFRVMEPKLAGLERERFLVLLLDGKHRLRRIEPVSEGTLTTSLVHPREVFKAAIREAAAAIIAVHNHPSGDPEPSPEDLEVTRRLRRAGRLVGIPLLDHVVIGKGRYVSLRERLW
ncbi:MAG: DNA repair protein RadC [Planctomycetota bacterium]|jgi:DNA repair protein RadC